MCTNHVLRRHLPVFIGVFAVCESSLFVVRVVIRVVRKVRVRVRVTTSTATAIVTAAAVATAAASIVVIIAAAVVVIVAAATTTTTATTTATATTTTATTAAAATAAIIAATDRLPVLVRRIMVFSPVPLFRNRIIAAILTTISGAGSRFVAA